MNLVKILSGLMQPGETRSISTLPISWSSPKPTAQQIATVRQNLIALAKHLRKLHDETGKEIVIAIEAEPGCFLGCSSDVRLFLQRNFLHPGRNNDLTEDDREACRRHLTVCHDICHAAVMYEDQKRELRSYRELGIRIGKVQVSSAIGVNWDLLSDEDKVHAIDRLKSFAEDRYLHQTATRGGPVGSVRVSDDLQNLIQSISAPKRMVGNWRIHFHVPISLEEMPPLQTTQDEIKTCLDCLVPFANDAKVFTGHFEVETYAWNVLPAHLRPARNMESLIDGIAEEMRFLNTEIAMRTAEDR